MYQITKMILLLLSTFSLLTSCKNSSSGSSGDYQSWGPEGTYYIPYEDFGDGNERPESLLELKDGISTQYNVHNGSLLITEREYSYSGFELHIASLEETHFDCNGLSVREEAEETLEGLEFEKIGDDLKLTYEEQSFVVEAATPEQIQRIKSLPTCEKL